MGLATGYTLRAQLRRLAVSARVRDCGRRAVSTTPGIKVVETNGERIAFWTGMLRCSCQSACPVCAQRRAAERAAELDSMMRVVHGARWQMVTLTLRHHAGQSLIGLLLTLFTAWRTVRAMRRVRKVFDARVKASCRALEVKFSWKNGWHPHFHLLWMTREWTHHERRILLCEWARAVGERKHLRNLIRWSTPIESWRKERVRYLSKLGAEIAGIGKDEDQAESIDTAERIGPFEVARLALSEEKAAELWREYQLAMKGRRILEMDERAKALVAAGWETSTPNRTWEIIFYSEEIRGLASFETIKPAILLDILEAGLSGPDPPASIDHFMRVHLENLNARGLPKAA